MSLTDGSALDLDGSYVTLAGISLIDGSISDGTITTTTAGSYFLQNGNISADLAGTGTVAMSGDGAAQLTGTNSFTGGVLISGGTLAVNSDAALGDPDGAVTFTGAGTLQALDDMTLSTTRVITTPSDPTVTASIDTNGFDVGLPCEVVGSGQLVKLGDGTLDLSGVDNSGLLGGLAVEGGLVAASGPSNLGYSASALIFDGGGLQATASFAVPSGKEIDVRAAARRSIRTAIRWRSTPSSGRAIPALRQAA